MMSVNKVVTRSFVALELRSRKRQRERERESEREGTQGSSSFLPRIQSDFQVMGWDGMGWDGMG